MAEENKVSGVLISSETATGKNEVTKKDWVKETLIIESEGRKYYVSAFNNQKDAEVAKASIGKFVEVDYTISGKYKNLVSGGITILTEAPKVGTNTPAPQQTLQTPANYCDATGRRIVRQNSWTQANKLLEGKEPKPSFENVRDLAHQIEEDIMRE